MQGYFAGDNHILEVLEFQNSSFFVSGGGCGSLTYYPYPRFDACVNGGSPVLGPGLGTAVHRRRRGGLAQGLGI